MADELGVTRQTLTRWMSDIGAPPRSAYLKVWALRCGVPYAWLADDRGPEMFGYRRVGERITEMLEGRPGGAEITDVEMHKIVKTVLAEAWSKEPGRAGSRRPAGPAYERTSSSTKRARHDSNVQPSDPHSEGWAPRRGRGNPNGAIPLRIAA
jgi:transcriptional regulator with XRE-family HTH domain